MFYIIIFSILFAYAVYPPIKLIARRGVPVPLAALIVYVVLGALVLGAVAWLTPAIATEVEALSHEFPTFVASAQKQIADPVHAPLLQHLPSGARTVIAENAGKTGAAVAGIAASVGANALGILAGTTATLTDIVLMLTLTLLIVSDLAQIQTFGTRMTPKPWREAVLSFVREVDQVIGGFVRWQISVAFGVGILGTVILSLLGVPYALLVGLVAGILSIVPIIGPFVAIIPVLVISFFTVGLVKSLLVLLLFGVVIAVQQNVLPLINARTVGVTPLVIFVALLLGSEAFGIVGALLSIPIAGIVRVAVTRLLPPDADADARIEAARDEAGEPKAATLKAIEEP